MLFLSPFTLYGKHQSAFNCLSNMETRNSASSPVLWLHAAPSWTRQWNSFQKLTQTLFLKGCGHMHVRTYTDLC